MGLVGQAHLDLSSFLLESESIYDRFRLWQGGLGFYFFLASTLVFGLDGLLGLDLCRDFKRFLFFGHGGLIECSDDIVLHHERLDLVLEVGLPDVDLGVHAFDALLRYVGSTM